MKKNENITILRPVKIFIDDLEKIFEILYSKYEENDLTIETDDYFYYNFEELSRSPEDFIYRLKITIKGKRGLEINFKDNIYIKSEHRNNLGLILKIKNILSDKKLVKSSFPYYFLKYNRFWYYIFVFLIPIGFSLIFKNFQNYVYIFFISVIFYVVWFRLFLIKNAEKILYSTIVLYKKSNILKKELELREKKYQKFTLIVGIIGLFTPFLTLIINFLITKFVGK